MQTEMRYERWMLPLSVPFGLGPKHSDVRVEGDRLHVSMGWAFHADIPLSSIAEVKPYSGRVASRGVHGWRGRWLVNGSGQGLVEVTIDPAVKARAVGANVTLRALCVSVTDPDALVAACQPAA